MIVLSPHQKQTLWSNSQPLAGIKVKLIARPGTGKTQTLCSYAIERSDLREFKSYQGIALLSYTNVARLELADRIKHLDVGYNLLEYPNYIGTFDSFVNNFIFLPYGARVMQCPSRPKLVGEPFSAWKGLRERTPLNRSHSIFFDCFTLDKYDSSHKLLNSKYVNGVSRRLPTDPDKIIRLKTDLFAKGYALQADANYLAYKLLTEHSDICKVVAGRFPVIIVDEAQDLTEVQHAILDILCTTGGLKNCILVGDNAQAIYEWNTARPDLLTSKEDFTLAELSHTYRCSPKICALLNRLTNDSNSLAPAGKNQDYGDDIKLQVCDLEAKVSIKSVFNDFVISVREKSAHDERVLRLAVLARSKALASRIRSSILDIEAESYCDFPIFKNETTRDFLRIAYYLQRDPSGFKAFGAYERYWRNLHSLDDDGIVRESISKILLGLGGYETISYRKNIKEKLERLKSLVTGKNLISEYGSINLDAELQAMFPTFDKIVDDCSTFVSRCGGDDIVSGFFSLEKEKQPYIYYLDNDRKAEVHIGTVHSVKGETYDGVLYFTKDKTTHSQGTPHERGNTWRKILTHDIAKCEEKRIAYVAISRAAQTLWIAGESEATSHFNELLSN